MPEPLKTTTRCALTAQMSSTAALARVSSSCLSSLARLRLPIRTIFRWICTSRHPNPCRRRQCAATTPRRRRLAPTLSGSRAGIWHLKGWQRLMHGRALHNTRNAPYSHRTPCQLVGVRRRLVAGFKRTRVAPLRSARLGLGDHGRILLVAAVLSAGLRRSRLPLCVLRPCSFSCSFSCSFRPTRSLLCGALHVCGDYRARGGHLRPLRPLPRRRCLPVLQAGLHAGLRARLQRCRWCSRGIAAWRRARDGQDVRQR
jgi:hypothetical protein